MKKNWKTQYAIQQNYETLLQKIAFFALALQMAFPREWSMTRSVLPNTHNDSEATLQHKTHHSDADSNRNPPPQHRTEMSFWSQQESQEVQFSGDRTTALISQPGPTSAEQGLACGRPLSHAMGFTERVEAPHGGHFAARLPKLEIPIFTGEPLEWHLFCDCFESAIDANPSLTGVQKLSYLHAQLEGEASRVIAGHPLSNLNYHHSVSLLGNRYGQPHKIISAHVQTLIELARPTNQLESLEQFHVTVESHVRCLQSLGKSPEQLKTYVGTNDTSLIARGD